MATQRRDDLEVVFCQYLQLLDDGLVVDPDAFASSHPEIADELLEYLRAEIALRRMAGPSFADELDGKATTSARPRRDTVAGSGAIDSTTPPIGRDRPNASGLTVPSQFGKYRVEKLVGEGAMGFVYRAVDVRLKRPVALKIPKLGSASDTEYVERFHREAQSAATLHHPNICSVFEVGEIDGVHFIAMAFVEGRALADYIGSKPQPVREIVKLVRKLALALAEAHDNGIVHRDLKPDNIMVSNRGEPIVMDFGLARCLSAGDLKATAQGGLLGTPAYMSPEQIDGDADLIGPQSDVFSLGSVLYELLTGRLPFSGDVYAVLTRIQTNDPEHPIRSLRPEVSEELAAICSRMMARPLDERYQSMRDVAAALTAIANRRAETAPDVDPNKSPAAPTDGISDTVHFAGVSGADLDEASEPPRPSWMTSRDGTTSRPMPWSLKGRSRLVARVSAAVACLVVVALLYWFIPGRESLPAPGQWQQYQVAHGEGHVVITLYGLGSADGERDRWFVVDAATDAGSGPMLRESGLFQVDSERFENEGRLSATKGFVWIGGRKDVEPDGAVVYGEPYAVDSIPLASWRDDARFSVVEALAAFESNQLRFKRIDSGTWDAGSFPSLDELTEIIVRPPESMLADGAFRRYKVPTRDAACEVEIRALADLDDSGRVWLLVETATRPHGSFQSLHETAFLKVDAEAYARERRLRVLEGQVWNGRRDDLGNRTVEGVTFNPDRDDLAIALGIRDRFAAHDALRLLFNASVVTTQPTPSEYQLVDSGKSPNDRNPGDIVAAIRPLPPQLPPDLGQLPLKDLGTEITGYLASKRLGIPRADFVVRLYGLHEDEERGRRLIGMEVESGDIGRHEFHEAALLWVDADHYAAHQRLQVEDGLVWIGNLKDGDRNEARYLTKFDANHGLGVGHDAENDKRIGINDVLKLMFDADVATSKGPFAMVRRRFELMRANNDRNVRVTSERVTLDDRDCRYTGRTLVDEDGKIQTDGSGNRRLSIEFWQHDNIAGWARLRVRLAQPDPLGGDDYDFEALLVGRTLDRYALTNRLVRFAQTAEPPDHEDPGYGAFNRPDVPRKNGVEAWLTGTLSLKGREFQYDVKLRTVGDEKHGGRMYRRIEIEIDARMAEPGLELRSLPREVASVLVDSERLYGKEGEGEDDEGEKNEFVLADFGGILESNGVRVAFNPGREDDSLTASGPRLGVHEVLALIFGVKVQTPDNPTLGQLRSGILEPLRDKMVTIVGGREPIRLHAGNYDEVETSAYGIPRTVVNFPVQLVTQYRVVKGKEVPWGIVKMYAVIQSVAPDASAKPMFEAEVKLKEKPKDLKGYHFGLYPSLPDE